MFYLLLFRFRISAAERRHERVEKWTKNVNLFEKDFLIVPINKSAHWYLAIICYPYLLEPVYEKVEKTENIDESSNLTRESRSPATTVASKAPKIPVCKIDSDAVNDIDEADSGESNLSFPDLQNERGVCLKRPVILIFDSLPNTSKKRVIATLKE